MSILNVEEGLVTLAQQGDEAAFEQLINVSTNKLKSLLRQQFQLQPTDLDEVIQVSSIKVFKKINTFRNDSSFTTWFFIVLRNEALDYVKKRNLINKHEVSARHLMDINTESEDYDVSPEQTLEDTAATLLEQKETLAVYRTMIEQILNELTPAHREIIRLSLDEEKSYREISEELGVPIGTVMSRLFFARKNAQKLIIEYAKRNTIQLDCLGERSEPTVS